MIVTYQKAISETVLKDTILMLIAEQNQKGGLLGRMLQPVVVDPASNWPLFAEKARELLGNQLTRFFAKRMSARESFCCFWMLDIHFSKIGTSRI